MLSCPLHFFDILSYLARLLYAYQTETAVSCLEIKRLHCASVYDTLKFISSFINTLPSGLHRRRNLSFVAVTLELITKR